MTIHVLMLAGGFAALCGLFGVAMFARAVSQAREMPEW